MSFTRQHSPLTQRLIMEGCAPKVATGRFRKRPVEVEAWLCPGGWELPEDAPQWIQEAYVWPPSPTGRYREIRAGQVRPEMGFEDWVWRVGTLEGVITAQEGDWIIRGVAGEIYPCKPDIFAATYEPVERAA